MFNKNELILDRVRSLSTHDIADGKLLFRLTSLEDSKLDCTAEGQEITDAIGARITTLYRSQKAKFSATNSLLSMGLMAEQFGTTAENGSEGNQIKDYAYEILTVEDGKITLQHKVADDIKYIYAVENKEIGTAYTAGATVSATDFVVNNEGNVTVINTPTGLTGKVYVEYTYMNSNAMRLAKKTSDMPRTVQLVIYAYFKDVCNENIKYSGKIICPRAKLNPEQVEIALTTGGKHPFEFEMAKDYCDETDDELFAIIISE